MPESKRHRDAQPAPTLPDDVILELILTRVPASAAVRFRTVCRAWRAALTSDHFFRAHRAARAAGQPEIVFFAPRPGDGGSGSTAFYTCKLDLATPPNASSSPPLDKAVASGSELVTVDNLRARDLVLSGTRPCNGLTLVFQFRRGGSAYDVCNLSTGEHVSLPPCAPAWRLAPHIGAPRNVLSSTGLGFDPVSGEHKVVRLYKGWMDHRRCEVYGLRSGGWRPCAGQVPPHAVYGLNGRPPVFVDGCFYWHIDTFGNFGDALAQLFITSISLTVDTEQFGWVRPPEELAGYSFHLAELDGSLCAVLDLRLDSERYELWTLPAGSGSPPSWSLRLRISLASFPRPIRDRMSCGIRMLPLASSFRGKILLATSCHEVYAYDPENDSRCSPCLAS